MDTSRTAQLRLEYLSLAELKPEAQNPRKHPKSQIKALARAIKEFGFTSPVLVDRDNTVIAGHCRLLAAQDLGMVTVPIVRLEHLSPTQIKAYRIADNRLAELADWDTDLLKNELQAIAILDVDFDLTLTGFELPKLDILMNPVVDTEDPETFADNNLPPVTKLGDIWLLGEHKVICGDALQPETYQKLMGTERADVVFTDPPYNVPVQGHILSENKHGHTDFAMAAGEMSDRQFESFLAAVINNLQVYSSSRSIHFVCMDWRHIAHLLAAGKTYHELKNICIWNKTNGGMGSFYRSKHEMVAVFKNGKDPHINNIELGKHGRYRTNVWDYAGQTSVGIRKNNDLEMHPTVKPVAMIADAILDCSERGALVLDPFGGSGSTLIAADQVHRQARLIELEPKYVDVTVERWQKRTGQKAYLFATGQGFDAVKADSQAGVQ